MKMYYILTRDGVQFMVRLKKFCIKEIEKEVGTKDIKAIIELWCLLYDFIFCFIVMKISIKKGE